MPDFETRRPRIANYPVSVSRMTEEEIETIDKAAAIRDETRGSYMARVILREARADLREAERKATAAA